MPNQQAAQLLAIIGFLTSIINAYRQLTSQIDQGDAP